MTNKKVAVIIGGNSGVGKRTALDLARQDVNIIIVARNTNKGQQVVQSIRQQTGNSDIQFIAADLTTESAVASLASQLSLRLDRIDILVSSLGILTTDQQLTPDGYDQNFVLNYLTHFWLINALLPLIKNSAQGRILLIGALPIIVRRLTPTSPQPVPSCSSYSGLTVTSNALVGRLLLIRKLATILQETAITINIFHPGNVPDSRYGTQSTGWLLRLFGPLMAQLSKKNQPIGARLATAPELASVTGQFFNESGKIIRLPQQFSPSLTTDWWQTSCRLTSQPLNY